MRNNKYNVTGIAAKMLICLFVVLGLWVTSANATTYQIGTGTTTNTQRPLYTCYTYNYSQSIYTNAELTAAGVPATNQIISQIRYFYVSSGTTYANWRNWTVYIGNTAQGTFTGTTNWVPLGSMTQVFSGLIPTPVTGTWINITLTTPFTWTAGSNLVVAVDENSTGYSCTASFRSYTGSGNKYMLYYSDPTNPNPAAPPAANVAPSTIMPQIQFEMNGATACSGMPSTPAVSGPSSVCSGVAFTVTATGASSGGGISYQWEVSTTGCGGFFSNVAGQTSTTLSASQTVASSYRLRTTCSNSGLTSYSNCINVGMNSYLACYCTPLQSANAFCCAMYISNVTVTGATSFSNNSTEGTGSYQNYSGTHIASQAQGGTVNISSTSVSYGMYRRVWIDYNDNGLFTDAGELVSSYGSTSAGVSTGSWVVPLSAPAGTHRMRFRADYYGSGYPADPCGQLSYGETEDYGFTVIAPVACSGSPAIYNANASPATICPGASSALSLSGSYSGITGLTYQWQSSTTSSSGPWTNITLPGNCAYTFRLLDSWGDGWNGASMQVRQGTNVITTLGPSFTTGTISNVSVNLNGSTTYNLYYVGSGSFPGEVGIQILNEAGTIIYNLGYGGGSPGTTLYTWTTNACPAPAQGATLTVNPSVNTWYQLVTTCSNSGLSSASNPVQVTMNSFINCYCSPTYTSGTSGCFYGVLTNVTLNTLNHAPACLNTAPYVYVNPAVGNATTNLVSGQTYTLSITSGRYNGVGVWIDFNQDGVYSASEYINISGNNNSSGNNWTGTATVNVPVSSASGLTGMRVSTSYYCCYPAPISANDACQARTYGETHDYRVSLIPLPASPPNPIEVGVPVCATGVTLQAVGSAPSGETWYWQTSATGTSTAQNAASPLTAYSNGTYYIRSQNNAFLTWSAASGSVTVVDFPAGPAAPTVSTPGGNPACGAVSLVASAAVSGTTNYWQGTNAVGFSTATDASSPYSATTDNVYYVRARDNSTLCWGDPTPTSVGIWALPTAPVISATPSTVCEGSPTALSATAPSAPPTGYTVASTAFAPTTPPGATTAGPAGDDVISGAITMPFSFNFYGTSYSSLYIGTNGFVTFNAGSPSGCCSGEALPTAGNPSNLIAVCWTDLNTGTSGNIDYYSMTNPNRFVVRYNNVGHYAGIANQVNAQIVIYQSGIIELHNTSILASGIMTAGVENNGGTLGTPAPGGNASSSYSASNSSWRFTPTVAMGFLWSGNTAGNGGIASGNEVLANTTANPTATTIYTMTITEPLHSCQSSSQMTVTGIPLPAGPTGTDGYTSCGQGTAVLSAVGSGGTLRWYRVPTGGTILGTGSTFTTPYPVNADSTFYVEEFLTPCVSVRTPVVARYTVPPAMTVASDVSFVCSGGGNTGPGGNNNNTANLVATDVTAYGYNSFSWSPVAGLSNPNIANPVATPATTTTYIVTATNGTCTAVGTVTVNAGVVPVIASVTATPPTVCVGNTSQIIAAVNGGAGGGPVPTGYCIPVHFVGTNTCNPLASVSTSGGLTNFSNVTGSTWTVGFNYYPSFIVSEVLGGSFTLSVQGTGGCNVAYYYIWIDFNRNGSFEEPSERIINGGTNVGNTLTNYTINVPVTASPGATRMRINLWSNNGIPPASACANETAYYGETEDYVLDIQGGTNFNYAWTGAGLSSYSIFNPVATLGSSSQQYNLIVSDSYNCNSHGNVTLAEPSANPGNTMSTANPVCPLQSFTLSTQNSAPGVNYQWQSSSNGTTWANIFGATNATYTTTQSAATYYRCNVGCASGSSYTVELLVAQNPSYNCLACIPIPTQSADEEIYSVTLNGNSTPAAYANTAGCTTPAPGPGSILGRYSNFRTLPALSTLLMGTTVPFTIVENECDGAFYYPFGTAIWIDYNQNGSFADAGERVFFESATATGPRTITGSFLVPTTASPGLMAMRIIVAEGYSGAGLTPCMSYGYGETEDWVVQVIPPNAISNSPVCEGKTILLDAPTTGISYSWTGPNGFTSTVKNPSITLADPNTMGGVYEVVVTTAGGSYNAPVTVVVNPAPDVAIASIPAFCEGTQALQFDATVSSTIGGSSFTYSWTGPAGFTSNIEDPVRTPSLYTHTGNYKFVATDNRGCKDSVNSFPVTVYQLPPVQLVVGGATNNICIGQTSVDLYGVGAEWLGGNYSYSWSTVPPDPNSLITVGYDPNTGQLVTNGYPAGSYTVTGTDMHGCEVSQSVTITETTPPAQPVLDNLGPIYLCSDDGGASWYNGVTVNVTNYVNDVSWTSGDTGPSLFINYPDVFIATYTDSYGCYGNSDPLEAISYLNSTDPVSITTDAPANIVCGGTDVLLTVDEQFDPLVLGFLGSAANWTWFADACGTTPLGTGSSITVNPGIVPGPHSFFVRAEGHCNTTACAEVVITVKEYSTEATSAAATPDILCAGDQTTLSLTGGYLGTGANWKWYAGGCPGTLVGIGASINVNTNSTTTYYVRAEGDCNTTICQSTAVTVRVPSTDPTVATSDAPANGICIGGDVTLTVNNGTLGDGANWFWYEDGCGTGTSLGSGASITITPAFEGLHSYYVRAEGPCNTTNCAAVSVLVGTYSVEASNITTTAIGNSICIGNNTSLTVNGGFLGTVADWKWYTSSCGGTLVGTGNTITVAPTATTTYYVRAEGSCNTTSCASLTIIVSTSAPAGFANIIGSPQSICSGNQGTFTCQTVANATYYSWSAPNGTTFNGNNPSPYLTTVPTVQVTFGPLPAGFSGYDICVFAGNGCGQSVTKCKYIRGRTTAPQVIFGTANSCPNSSWLYSVLSSPGADTYLWSVTGNATFSNGNDSIVTTGTSTTVFFGPAWTNGTLSVRAQMNCGYSSPPKTINIVSTPLLPGIISGNALVCPLNTYTYSISPVAGATLYNWSSSVPGASINGGGNTLTTASASVSIAYPAAIPGGSTVSVSATGSCGTSADRVKNIGTGLANAPGFITGPVNGQCGAQGTSYSVLPVQGATSYFWSATNGAVTSSTNGLTSITFDFPANFVTSTISVVSVNSCGNSVPQTKVVTGAAGQSGLITGNQAVCNGAVETYSTTGASGATSYFWEVPADAFIINGQNQASIDVLWGTMSGDVTVYSVNDCGTSIGRSTAVSIICRQAQIDGTTLMNASLYPNPTGGNTTLKFETATAGNYQVSVVDVTGRVLSVESVDATEGINMHELDLTTYAKGLYMVRMERSGEPMQLLKVTVE